jgi:hypothetical protein
MGDVMRRLVLSLVLVLAAGIACGDDDGRSDSGDTLVSDADANGGDADAASPGDVVGEVDAPADADVAAADGGDGEDAEADRGSDGAISDDGSADGSALLPEDHPLRPAQDSPGEWVWVPVEGARCRDGTATGIGVRWAAGAEGLMFYLQGGGACFDAASCGGNRASYGATDFAAFAAGPGNNGILSTADGDNPVADFHVVFVPYCTGDVHGGRRADVDVPGGPTGQDFVGHVDMERYLELLGPAFHHVDAVFLVGVSAGGFGTLFNYEQVAAAFPEHDVILLDDSGPLLPNDDAMSPCLQRLWRDLWGLDEVLPSGCSSCVAEDGDGLSELHAYLGNAYPDAYFGLLSTYADLVIRGAYGAGVNDCEGGLVTAAAFRAGLETLRDDTLSGADNWVTYYAGGPLHVLLAFFPTLAVDGVALKGWIGDLLAGEAADVAAP